MSGRLSRRVEATGEALMFAVSMSVLLTGMMWKKEMVRPSMQGLLGWMLEIRKTKRRHGQTNGVAETAVHSNGVKPVADIKDTPSSMDTADKSSNGV